MDETKTAPRNALAHTIRKDGDWLIDDAGNKNSISYWGSENAARTALESLEDCNNCINCSDCSNCLDCSDCSGCLDCSGCWDCKNVASLRNKSEHESAR